MKETRILMGMPVTVEIVDPQAGPADLEKVFDYFSYVDEKFSTYKETSEITLLNKGLIKENNLSPDMKTVLELSEDTGKETRGYFDVRRPDGSRDPSGLVKGWAIWNAAKLIESSGFKNFYVEAGGDIQVGGKNKDGLNWRIGIKNPLNPREIVKVITVDHEGVATSGTYERGRHIWNPKTGQVVETGIVSLTVVGPDIYEADRYATACFAMGRDGPFFLEKLRGLEGYIIDKDGRAVMTSGFKKYELKND